MQHLHPVGLQGFDNPVEYQPYAHGGDKEADDPRDGVDALLAKAVGEPPGGDQAKKGHEHRREDRENNRDGIVGAVG